MTRRITSTTAADGTELQLRERDDGLYEIRDSAGSIIEEPSATDEQGARAALAQTREDIGVGLEAEQSRQSRRSQSAGFGGGFGGGWQSGSRDTDSGGLFGGGMSDDGGFFGGGGREHDRERTSDENGSGGGLFGGFGGFGGGGSARRERDAESGRFAPTRREQVGFEMERDNRGRFSGRADDDERDKSGGFLGGLFR